MGYIVTKFCELTEQEIYDKVCEHLDQQGERAVTLSKDGKVPVSCAYQTEQGTKCAVGALMTDEELAQLQEGDLLKNDWVKIVEEGLAPVTHIKLLRALQEAHDQSNRWKDRQAMVNNLKEIARRFNLTPTNKEFLKLPLLPKQMHG